MGSLVLATSVDFRVCLGRWGADASSVMTTQRWPQFWLAETRTAASSLKKRAAAWTDGAPGIPKCGFVDFGEYLFVVTLTACRELLSSLFESFISRFKLSSSKLANRCSVHGSDRSLRLVDGLCLPSRPSERHNI